MIVQLFDDVESVRIQFITNTEPLIIEIPMEEIAKEINEIVQTIVTELKEFMTTIKVKGFVDFTGKFSRFVPLRKQIVETIIVICQIKIFITIVSKNYR
jgi:uncharacterized membrane protein YkvI